MTALDRAELERRILLERDGIIAVDKSPGLTTSGRTLDDPDCLQYALMERAGGMVWVVHQLDADTSGVNLFCTEKRLVEGLKNAIVAKQYRGLLRGIPQWSSASCRAPIGEIREGELGVTPQGRACSTTFEIERRCVGLEVEAVEASIQLFTGRTHQIRIHAAAMGHPLIGEEWYRRPACTLHPRQALHAERVRLGPPFNVEIVAPMPLDLVALIEGKAPGGS